MAGSDSHATSNSRPRTSVRHARWLWLPFALCVAVAAYAVVGFVLVPKAVHYAATQFVREHYGRTLSIGSVHANPFRLTLEIKQLSLPDRDDQPMLAADKLALDFEAWASLWERAYVLKSFSLLRPYVRAVARKGGTFNLQDLILPPEKDAPEKNEGLPALWVQSLHLDQGAIDFIDLARREAFSQGLAPISFVLKNFRTTPRGGDFQLTAKGEQGAHFAWKGKLALSPRIESIGSVSIRELQVTNLADYLGDALPFAMPNGTVELTANYRMRIADVPQAEVKLTRAAILQTSLRARNESQTLVKIPKILVSDATLILETKRLDIRDVLLEGIQVSASLEADKTLNLERLFAAKASPGAAPKTLEPVKRAVTEPDWALQIARMRLTRAQIDAEDRAIAPGTRIELSNMQAELNDVSLDLAKPVRVSFETHLNRDAGTIKAEGSIRPAPFAAKLEIAIREVDLALAQPYLAPYAALTIQDGTLDTQGTLTFDASLRFAGQLSLNNLVTVDNALRQDLLRVRRLEAQRLVFQQNPDTLTIDQVLVDKPFAKVVLSNKQVLNLSEVFSPSEAEAKTTPRTTARKKQPEREESTSSVDATPSMVIHVGKVAFSDMRLNFSDYYVQPNFSADIRALSGALKGLSTDPRSRASVKLKGHLGDNSPVVISGRSQPFAFKKFTDLSIECENIALPVFNPYSGRFAGYNITRGELSTNLRYQITNSKLEASHHIRISQLTWGEKTETKEKAPLPVKLATVLLRDRDGVISLDVPVKGTLDDPSFRVGPIIWQVVKNIIVKAATAPFDLLGSLFKGAEKARYVSFSPGKDQLNSEAKQGLASLGKAMRERPDLKLDVPVGTVADMDIEALRAHKFEESLKRSVAESLSRREKRDGVPEYTALAPDQKIEALEKLHKRLTGKEPRIPAAPKTPEGTSRKSAKVMQQQFQADKLAEEIRSKVPVDKSEVEALGQRRGEAIEAELLKASQVETSRVFLSKKGKVTRQGEVVRFELHIK